MIGDEREKESIAALSAAMEKMQRNIDGCGSLEALRTRYPAAYRKQKTKIHELTCAYVTEALKSVTYNTKIPKEEILSLWGSAESRIEEAIKINAAEKVQQTLSDFIFEVFKKFAPGGNVFIKYSLPDDIV